MYCLIHYFFGLILGVFSNFLLNAIYKDARCSKAAMQEDFQFVPGHRNSFFTFEFGLVLLPPKKVSILKKWHVKKKNIWTLDSSHSKMVFLLLTEVIILHISLTLIYVLKSSLQRLFWGFFGSEVMTTGVWACKIALKIC